MVKYTIYLEPGPWRPFGHLLADGVIVGQGSLETLQEYKLKYETGEITPMMLKATTTYNSGKAAKSWRWSYSKLKNFEACPKKHWHTDLAKDLEEEEDNEAMAAGNLLHKAFHMRLGPKRIPFSKEYAKHEPWALKVLNGLTSTDKLLVEQKLAIREDYGPTGFFDNDAWYSGIADVLKIRGPVCWSGDWKTGKVLDDSVQLALTAQAIFSHHPEVQFIRSEYVWLKEDATTTLDMKRSDLPGLWAGVLPRVALMKRAHDTGEYPPQPGGLCRRYCGVKQCVHHGG